jgi:hypothetical protein
MKFHTILYFAIILILNACTTQPEQTKDPKHSEYLIFEDSSMNRFVYVQLESDSKKISGVQKIKDNSLSFSNKGLVYIDENGEKTLFDLNRDISQDLEMNSWLKDSKNFAVMRNNEIQSESFDKTFKVKGIGFSEYDIDGNIPQTINCNCQEANAATICDVGGEGAIQCAIEEKNQLVNLKCIVSCSAEYYPCCSDN